MDSNFKKVSYAGGIAHMAINAGMIDTVLGRLQKYYRLNLFKPYNKSYTKLSHQSHQSHQTQAQHLKHDYLIRYLLNAKKSYIYATLYNGIKFCFHIVDDKLYSVKHRFSEDLFLGDTLLEGSLVTAAGKAYYFLVDDIIVYDGHTIDMHLEDKLKLLNEIIDTKYRADPVMDPCRILLADHVEAKYFRSFMEDYLQNLPYKDCVEGIVFVPLEGQANLTCNILPIAGQTVRKTTKDSIIVADPKTTICNFLVEKTEIPDVYNLYINAGAKSYYDQACVPDKATSLMLYNTFKHTYTCIMRCNYNAHLRGWTPTSVSSKKGPDDISLLTLTFAK
jgi:hypothetical protein